MFDKMPQPTRKDLRLFGFIFTGFLLLITGLGYWREPEVMTWKHHAWKAAPVPFLMAILIPQHLFWVHRGMMYLALPIGWVVIRVFSLVLLVVVLAPIRLLTMLSGSDKMRRKVDRGAPSYWMDAEYPTSKPEDYPNWY